MFCLIGCSPSPGAPASPRATEPLGIVIPPLSGESASNEMRTLNYIRHLPKNAPFERRTFTSARTRNAQLKYLLLKPKGFQPDIAYPLVLSLHGGAPRRHFEDLLEPFLPGLAYGLGRLICDETQEKHPSFVLAPWSNEKSWDETNLRLVLELLDALQTEFRIDTNRIYVTGQSMGGFGTWAIITEHPERFAVAVPICGGGESRQAPRAKDISLWAFHGSADHVVPVSYTRQMIAALKAAGGTPLYWEYKDADHSATAERAYCEPGLIDWMFAQSKANRAALSGSHPAPR